MNAPFSVAQAVTSSNTAAAPRIVKVTKPADGQAITVQMDGSVKLDLTAISNEKITLVRVGERLTILFENKSTVTIDPFFDASGRPLQMSGIELETNRIVSGEELATIFPITDDQSVLPAAGDQAPSAQNTSSEFGDPTVDPLASLNPLDLLGQEELGNWVSTDDPNPLLDNEALAIDLVPTQIAGALARGVVEEEHNNGMPARMAALSEGGNSEGGVGYHGNEDPNDLTGGPETPGLDQDDGEGNDNTTLTVTGEGENSLAALFTGGDGALHFSIKDVTAVTPSEETPNAPYVRDTDGNIVQSHDAPVIFANFVDGPNSDTIEGIAGDRLIFTLEVRDDGSWTFTLHDTLDHPIPSDDKGETAVGVLEETLGIDFSSLIQGVDSNGTPFAIQGTGIFVVDVIDDTPELFAYDSEMPTLTVDETDLSADDSTSFAFNFSPSFGADGQGAATTYKLGINEGETGLVDTATGEKVELSLTVGGVVEGRAGGELVFTVSVDSNGNVTLNQLRSVEHTPDTGANQSTTLSAADLVTLTATISDFDGDTASATLNIGENLVFHDDGPSIDVEGKAPTLTVDESAFGTNDTQSFAAAFSHSFGADGEGAITYALGINAGSTGLVDTLTGEPVVLSVNENGVVEGRADGELVFTVSVDGQGNVTLDQQRAVVHSPDTGVDQSTGLSTADLITLTATITDKDGDSDTATLNIGDKLEFKDDAPSLTVNDNALTLTMDESLPDGGSVQDEGGVAQNDEATIALPAEFAGFGSAIGAATADGSALFNDADYGADGQSGTVAPAYSLTDGNGQAIADGTASGVFDAVTNTEIYLFEDNGMIVGRVGNGEGAGNPVAFAISVDGETGTVTTAQYRAVEHNDSSDHDENGSGEPVTLDVDIHVTKTVTDGDGDKGSATSTSPITVNFEDDGPSAQGESYTATEGQLATVNAVLVIDLSLSMGNASPDPIPGNNAIDTRLELLQAAVQNLLSNSDVTFNQITIYTFGVGAQFVGQYTIGDPNYLQDAINDINDFAQGDLQGGTQYDSAANLVGGNGPSGYAQLPHPDATETNLYFLSDGDPQSGSSLDANEQAAWTNFINGHITHVYAVGFGGIVNTNFLEQIAPGSDDVAFPVLNPSQLEAILQGSLPGNPSGNVLTNDSFGTDGGYIKSVTIEGKTYTFDGNNTITVKDGNGVVLETITGKQILVETEIDGRIIFNFGDNGLNHAGDWDYLAPANGIGQTHDELFTYVLVDNDGDTASATLQITVGPDQKVPEVTGSTATVYEDGLDTAGVYQHGANSETQNGTFQVNAKGEGYTLTLDGDANGPVTVTAVGNTVVTSKGVLTITSISAPDANGNVTYGYSYTLTAPQTHSGQGEVSPLTDTITMHVTDTTGDSDPTPGSIVVTIVDDVAVATDEAPAATTEGGAAVTGNVLTNDDFGADQGSGAGVSGIRTGAEAGSGTSGTVGSVLQGQWGTLTINVDGSYSYTPKASVPAGSVDTFTYTMQDADGDTDTAQLSFTFSGDNNAPTASNDSASTSDAAGDSAGSNSDAFVAQSDTGSLAFNFGADGAHATTPFAASYDGGLGALVSQTSAAGVTTITTASWTLTINEATGAYTFTQNAAYAHASGDATDSGTVTVTIMDADGSTAVRTLTLGISDDTPVAANDAGAASEGGAAIGGNVLSNDDIGADHGSGTGVSAVRTGTEAGAGTAGTVGSVLQGQWGTLTLNADGTYSYTPKASVPAGSTDVFTYTVIDADGDTDTAQLTITFTGDNNAPTATSDSAGTSDAAGDSAASNTDAFVGQSDTGSLAFNFGSDGAHATTPFAASYDGGLGSLVSQTSAAGVTTITTAAWILTINEATGAYNFTQNAAYAHASSASIDSGVVTVTIMDADGTPKTATLTLSIGDDTPSATADTSDLGNGSTATGNVLSNDDIGADHGVVGTDAHVSHIASDNVPANDGAIAAGGSTTISGEYGDLTLHADGSYTYTRDPDALLGGTDTFTYTLTDSDNDSTTATLTFTLEDTGALIVGSNENDATGAPSGNTAYDHAVPNGPSGTDGQLNGTDGDDIIVGDPGALPQIGNGDVANIVLVLDTSSSMVQENLGSDSRFDALIESVQQLLQTLSETGAQAVRVHIVQFDIGAEVVGTYDIVVNGQGQASVVAVAQDAVGDMDDAAGTNYEAGMREALAWINGSGNMLPDATVNQVLFVSDGEPNYYVNGNGGNTGSGSAAFWQTALNEVLGSDNSNEVQSIINAGFKIDAVGIGLPQTQTLTLNEADTNDDVNAVGGLDDGSSTNDDNGVVLSANGVDIALVSAWSSSTIAIGNLVDTVYNDDGIGIGGNSNLDGTEVLRFDFGPGTDYDGAGTNFTTNGFNGRQVTYATVTFDDNNSNGDTTFQWTIHFVGGGQESGFRVVTNDENQTLTATQPENIGKYIDYIEFSVSAGQGRVDLISVVTPSNAMNTLDLMEGSTGDGADNIDDPDELSDTISDLAGGVTIPAATGNDTINGGAGNDIIFGDVMNTDALAAAEGLSTPAGSGWDVFRQLENSAANALSDPGNNGADWTRLDTLAYIKQHAAELAQEMTSPPRTGGNDKITGGAGDDTIYAQEGNDTVYYTIGDGSDSVDGGSETVADTLDVTGTTGNDTFFVETVAEYNARNAVDYTGPREILLTNGGDQIYVAMSDIEEIVVHGNGGTDTLTVSGDFDGTALKASTIHYEGTAGDDVLNLSVEGRDSSHRVVADGGAHSTGDAVSFDFDLGDATYAAHAGGGLEVTHIVGGQSVTDIFTNFENFTFEDVGTLTLEQILDPQAPTTDVASGSGVEGQVAPIQITLTGNDDSDGGTVVGFKITGLPANGTLYYEDGNGDSHAVVNGQVLNATGEALTLYFVPAENFSGDTSFTYAAIDNLHYQGNTATATISVSAVNDAPVLTGDLSATVLEGGSVTIGAGDLGYNDPDDVNAGIVFSVSNVVNGEVRVGGVAVTSFTATQLANGQVSFAHNGSETTSASFSVSVEDGNEDGSAPIAQTFNLDVTPVNDAPVATAVTLASVAEDGSRLITAAELLAGVSDADGTATITSLAIQGGGHGTLVNNNNGTWTYTPASNDDTSVTFSYTASDGSLSASSTATLDITPVNDAPAASTVNLGAVIEDGSRVITAAQLLAGVTDVDGPAASITALTIQSGNGSIVDNGNGTWTYTPALNDDTNVTFAYTVSDGALTASSTATLDIAAVNDAAVFTVISEDTSVKEAGGVANGTLNDPTATGHLAVSDADGDDTFQSQSGAAKTYGSFTISADGQWSYTLDKTNLAVQKLNEGSAPLHDLITVKSADGTEYVIDITINGANDAPVIVAAASVSVPESTTTVTDVNATDADAGASLSYSLVEADGTDYAKFHIDATTGELTFVSAPDFEHPADVGGVDGDNSYQVVVRVEDEHGAINDQTVTVNVTNTNEQPAAADVDTDVLSGSLAGTDPDHDPLTFALVGNGEGAQGDLTVNADGSYSYVLHNVPGDDNNNTNATARDLPGSGTSASNGPRTVTVNGDILFAGDVDRYEVVVRQGGNGSNPSSSARTINIDLDDPALTVTLYNAAGQQLVTGTGGLDYTAPSGGSATTGTYYIQVSGAEGDYQMTVGRPGYTGANVTLSEDVFESLSFSIGLATGDRTINFNGLPGGTVSFTTDNRPDMSNEIFNDPTLNAYFNIVRSGSNSENFVLTWKEAGNHPDVGITSSGSGFSVSNVALTQGSADEPASHGEIPHAYTATETAAGAPAEAATTESLSFTINSVGSSGSRTLTFNWEGLDTPIVVTSSGGSGSGGRIQAHSNAIDNNTRLDDYFDISVSGSNGQNITLTWLAPGNKPAVTITEGSAVDIGTVTTNQGHDAVGETLHRVFTFDHDDTVGDIFNYTVTDSGALSDQGSVHFLHEGGELVIQNFEKGVNGDVLDFDGILQGATTATLDQYLHFENSGPNTIMKVDLDGAGTNHQFEQVATFQGTNLGNNALNELLANGQIQA